jgi:hypothetical protein
MRGSMLARVGISLSIYGAYRVLPRASTTLLSRLSDLGFVNCRVLELGLSYLVVRLRLYQHGVCTYANLHLGQHRIVLGTVSRNPDSPSKHGRVPSGHGKGRTGNCDIIGLKAQKLMPLTDSTSSPTQIFNDDLCPDFLRGSCCRTTISIKHDTCRLAICNLASSVQAST